MVDLIAGQLMQALVASSSEDVDEDVLRIVLPMAVLCAARRHGRTPSEILAELPAALPGDDEWRAFTLPLFGEYETTDRSALVGAYN